MAEHAGRASSRSMLRLAALAASTLLVAAAFIRAPAPAGIHDQRVAHPGQRSLRPRLRDEPAADSKALPPARHEAKDVSLRFMIGLLALIGGTLLLPMTLASLMFPREMRDPRFALPFPQYPAPRLQNDPALDMQNFLAAEHRQLDSTGWQDRAAGIVHIPIDQAMHLVAKEGIPGWPGAPPAIALSAGERR